MQVHATADDKTQAGEVVGGDAVRFERYVEGPEVCRALVNILKLPLFRHRPEWWRKERSSEPRIRLWVTFTIRQQLRLIIHPVAR